ncbi:hypothetical protein O2N63_04730 [Aliiroseovarius sp. KMU-50]|uniref:Uncharacterized protein n=1 Tax=Aliiroseovarius salicola TaxID=3009082 RepID=A0ABT4VYR2_9RHOB|nr:hypothetical protein [Aliiroseovarius sp. KMU-50]MDA5093387.1 hypothetical protein [Aliiroseovarius sp. KMU-50]
MMNLIAKFFPKSRKREFLNKHTDSIDLIRTLEQISNDPGHIDYALSRLDALLVSKPERIEAFLISYTEQIEREQTEKFILRDKGWSVQSARSLINATYSTKLCRYSFYRENGGLYGSSYAQSLGNLEGFRGSVTLYGEAEYVNIIEFKSSHYEFSGSDAAHKDYRECCIADFKGAASLLLSDFTASHLWSEANTMLGTLIDNGVGVFPSPPGNGHLSSSHLTDTGYHVSILIRMGDDWSDRTAGNLTLLIRAPNWGSDTNNFRPQTNPHQIVTDFNDPNMKHD